MGIVTQCDSKHFEQTISLSISPTFGRQDKGTDDLIGSTEKV
jgi:hypothetical protein